MKFAIDWVLLQINSPIPHFSLLLLAPESAPWMTSWRVSSHWTFCLERWWKTYKENGVALEFHFDLFWVVPHRNDFWEFHAQVPNHSRQHPLGDMISYSQMVIWNLSPSNILASFCNSQVALERHRSALQSTLERGPWAQKGWCWDDSLIDVHQKNQLQYLVWSSAHSFSSVSKCWL